ncbi:transposase [Mesorhizobium sp. M1307]|uniref:transposase n=1 Tax=Mesorhizobium sp. M1307 TaxID=2957079 RepID=UPI003335987C
MDQGGDDRCHPVDDALAAYHGLSEIERRNIVNAAKALAGQGKYVSPDELISEAYVRMAEGRRLWPTSKPFTVFFAGAMKSLVSDRMFLTDEGKVVRLKNKLAVVRPDDLSLVAANDDSEDLRDKILLEEVAKVLEARIADDEGLELLWTGIQCDMKGKELQEALGVDVKQLATLRTRLSRLIDKLCVEYQAKEGRS